MSDRHLANNSDNMAPAISHAAYQDSNVDHVINEYMERLGTRLNILETELKYAWRALDLLSQEYIKMWERLEKLEGLLFEQQSVISQLMDFYTSGSGHRVGPTVSMLEGRLGRSYSHRYLIKLFFFWNIYKFQSRLPKRIYLLLFFFTYVI